jgi:uncharacterized protein (TIGR00730 family)
MNNKNDVLNKSDVKNIREAIDRNPKLKEEQVTNESLKNTKEEQYYLEGPHSRLEEVKLIFSFLIEFVRGFRTLHFVGPCVCVFGSARIPENDPLYKQGVDVGIQLAKMGFTVMTGGGPGLMEAANRGAKEAGGRSVGCNIILPKEQSYNRFLDKVVTFRYFFIRKVMLFKYSYAFIALPGGMGTMDELFEALTLIQTKKVLEYPVVLLGKNYWKNLLELLQQMVEAKTIDAADLNLVLITDSIEEAMDHIREHSIKKFGLHRIKAKAPKPSKVLGEKGLVDHEVV